MAKRADIERLEAVLPAFRGIPYKADDQDLASALRGYQGRAITLRAAELAAIGERIRDMQLAIEQATMVQADPSLMADMRVTEAEAYERQQAVAEALAKLESL